MRSEGGFGMAQVRSAGIAMSLVLVLLFTTCGGNGGPSSSTSSGPTPPSGGSNTGGNGGSGGGSSGGSGSGGGASTPTANPTPPSSGSGSGGTSAPPSSPTPPSGGASGGAGGGSSGGGTSGGSGAGGGTPGQAQGVYTGTVSNGNSFDAIVLPNDRIYIVSGPPIGDGEFNARNMLAGQGTSSNGTFTATVSEFSLGSTSNVGSVSIKATYVVGSTFKGTATGNGITNTFSGVPFPASQFNYSSSASLSSIVGNWSGILLNGNSATLNVNSDGTFSGSDNSGCSFTGTATLDSPKKNFFDVAVTLGGSCTLAGQTLSGVGVERLLPDGITRRLTVAVTSGDFSVGDLFIGTSAPVSLTGTWGFPAPSLFSTSVTPPTGITFTVTGQLNATFSEAATPDANGNFALSGDISFKNPSVCLTANGDSFALSSGIVSGSQVQFVAGPFAVKGAIGQNGNRIDGTITSSGSGDTFCGGTVGGQGSFTLFRD